MKPEQIEKIKKDVLETNNHGDSLDNALIQAGWDAHIQSLADTPDEGMLNALSEIFCLDCFNHQKNHACDHTDSDAHDCYTYLAKAVLSNVQAINRAKVEKQQNQFPETEKWNSHHFGYERCRQDTLKLLGGK